MQLLLGLYEMPFWPPTYQKRLARFREEIERCQAGERHRNYRDRRLGYTVSYNWSTTGITTMRFLKRAHDEDVQIEAELTDWVRTEFLRDTEYGDAAFLDRVKQLTKPPAEGLPETLFDVFPIDKWSVG